MKTYSEMFRDRISGVDGTTAISRIDYRIIQMDAMVHAINLVRGLPRGAGGEDRVTALNEAECVLMEEASKL